MSTMSALSAVWDFNSKRPCHRIGIGASKGRALTPIVRNGKLPPFMRKDGPLSSRNSHPDVIWNDANYIADDEKETDVWLKLSQTAAVAHLQPSFTRSVWPSVIGHLPGNSRLRQDCFFSALMELHTTVTVTEVAIDRCDHMASILGLRASSFGRRFPVAPQIADLLSERLQNNESGENPDAKLKDELEARLLLTSHAVESPCHLQLFRENLAGDERIVADQGIGDLSLNPGHVAVLVLQSGQLEFVGLPGERIDRRNYLCLASFREPYRGQFIVMERFRFQQFVGLGTKAQIYDRVRGDWVDVTSNLRFAVAGKPVVASGKAIDIKKTCHFWYDRRHVLAMPKICSTGRDRKQGDLWLGELDFQDLRVFSAALAQSVTISWRQLGVTECELLSALADANYLSVRHRPAKEGQYRMCADGRLQIRYRRAKYPMSGMGITLKGSVISLAWQGPYNVPIGFTIEEFAQRFQQLGCYSAVVFEEGQDSYLRLWTAGSSSLPPMRARRPFVFVITQVG